MVVRTTTVQGIVLKGLYRGQVRYLLIAHKEYVWSVSSNAEEVVAQRIPVWGHDVLAMPGSVRIFFDNDERSFSLGQVLKKIGNQDFYEKVHESAPTHATWKFIRNTTSEATQMLQVDFDTGPGGTEAGLAALLEGSCRSSPISRMTLDGGLQTIIFDDPAIPDCPAFDAATHRALLDSTGGDYGISVWRKDGTLQTHKFGEEPQQQPKRRLENDEAGSSKRAREDTEGAGPSGTLAAAAPAPAAPAAPVVLTVAEDAAIFWVKELQGQRDAALAKADELALKLDELALKLDGAREDLHARKLMFTSETAALRATISRLEGELRQMHEDLAKSRGATAQQPTTAQQPATESLLELGARILECGRPGGVVQRPVTGIYLYELAKDLSDDKYHQCFQTMAAINFHAVEAVVEACFRAKLSADGLDVTADTPMESMYVNAQTVSDLLKVARAHTSAGAARLLDMWTEKFDQLHYHKNMRAAAQLKKILFIALPNAIRTYVRTTVDDVFHVELVSFFTSVLQRKEFVPESDEAAERAREETERMAAKGAVHRDV